MKKVLIITYYWPPAGGPGVQRVLKFAKYLPEFGWEPVILTVADGNYPAIDESLLAEIPDNIKVYKTKTLEPFALYNKLTGKTQQASIDTFAITKTNKSFKDQIAELIRSYLFMPDARKGWKYYAVSKGINIVNEENIDLILSSSPPHSLQLIAQKISKKTNTPWMADFRDPWSSAFWLSEKQKNGFIGKQNKKLEQKVFKQLNHFSTVSQGVMESFTQQHQLSAEQGSLIYNGFDETDFKKTDTSSNSIFTIRYIGTLAASQNPLILFEALKSMKQQGILFKMEFWGKFDSIIKSSCESYDLEDRVTFHPYVSHNRAVELMASSDMLLLVIPFENAKGILTGKVFEYIATNKPILALGPDYSEAKDIIEDNDFGRFFSSPEGIQDFISTCDSEKETKREKNPNRARFSRRNATKQLAQAFNNIISSTK